MEIKYLDKIKSPTDVKKLSPKELEILCAEIRETLIDTVSQNGGHLASNLGVVELTVALHKIFNSPHDQIIWDVGHQSYTHKLLTGRYERFSTLRKEDGLSGFPRPDESRHDIFYSGHSSTSVSEAFGMACAKKINNDTSSVISVLGDGSFTGGMIYEAMNNAGRMKSRLIVILNENEMSISKNVGALAKYLAVIRSKPEYFKIKAGTENLLNKIPFIGKYIAGTILRIKTFAKNSIYGSNFFEDLGFRYMGPVDGHNLKQLCSALEGAKISKGPVLLHIHTVKGKGYDPAERLPSVYHGISRFDIDSAEPIVSGPSFSGEFGKNLCNMASVDKKICAVTAAMSIGTGLGDFSKRFANRFFDVGIAEQHAVTFAAGLSKYGMKPVFAVYSTFLQRAYDQLLHDGALQRQNLTIAVDRAGFVGEDGETHQGIYDVAFLNSIPDVTVYSPSCYDELKSDLEKAVNEYKCLTAVRYPRGSEPEGVGEYSCGGRDFAVYGDKNAKTAVVTYGRIFGNAVEAVKRFDSGNEKALLIKLNKIKPINPEILPKLLRCERVFFFEEGTLSGGVGEKVALKLLENGFKGEYKITAVPDCFVKQATVESQLKKYMLDTDGMFKILTE
ncbi:MAG: 1-deoxy-D-xylulose-5-phosphate synthase [Clostridiales bacterium]|nr:1-deoxy-D-xylulose-5-phosphate synthase [Clostridiales bacterium]